MTNLLQNWFSDRVFYITIVDADIESLKSFHRLFDKYLDHMLVKFENRMVQTIQNFDLFDKNWLNFFDKVSMQFLEDVYVTETIVWC